MPFPQPPFNSPVQTEPSLKGKVSIKAVWQNWLQLVQIFLADLTNFGPTEARPTENLWVGMPFFDTTLNVPVYWNGGAWVTASPSGTVTAVTGTAPIASSGGTTPNISISQANATTNGYLSSTDWNTFNSKQPAGTYVTNVTGTSPIVSSGGASPAISIPAANATTNGYLTSTDWNTFNNASIGTFVNVKTYGATGNGSTDDTTSIQNAINANPGRTIYFPAGAYVVNATLNVASMNIFCGDGSRASYFYTSSATNDIFNVTTNLQCGFRDIGFQTSVTRTAGAYVKVDPPTGYESKMYFFDVGMDHPYIGINFVDANIFLVDFCYFTNYVIAIQVANAASNDAGDSCISNCTFDAGSVSSGVGINQTSSGGLKITSNKILHGAYGYIGQFNTPITNTSILIIANNSFESSTTANIAINTTSYPFSQALITGNQLSVLGTGVNTVGTAISGLCISSNVFHDVTNTHGATGISLGGGSVITIGENSFDAFGTGIVFQAGNPSAYVLPQNFNNCTTRYSGIGSNQIFTCGQARNGQAGAWPFIVSYGTFAGNTLWCTGDQYVSFGSTPFPQIPIVNAYIIDSASSGYGFQIKNVTASGFTINVLGWTQANYVQIAWNAYLTGQ